MKAMEESFSQSWCFNVYLPHSCCALYKRSGKLKWASLVSPDRYFRQKINQSHQMDQLIGSPLSVPGCNHMFSFPATTSKCSKRKKKKNWISSLLLINKYNKHDQVLIFLINEAKHKELKTLKNLIALRKESSRR